MAEQDEPVNDFVEFVEVWKGFFSNYPEAIILYDSRSGGKGLVLRHIPADVVTVSTNTFLKNCRI